VGNHPSPFYGFAIEFAGHRQYVPGDDLRHLDWKVYYRSGRYMTKQYELETNFIAHLVLDVSETMKFAHKHGRKLDYAAFVAVAMAQAIVSQTDMVAATFFADSIVESIPPSGAEEVVAKLSRSLETAEMKDRTAIGRVLSQLAEQIGRRKIVFVISDFFSDVKSTFDGIKRLLYSNNEVVLFHVLDPIEIDFDHPGRVELIELEGAGKMQIEGRNIRESYNALFGAYLKSMTENSRRLNVDYVVCNTAENFGMTLARYLNTRMLTGGRK
jgi:uncharacterized protein (DUF58 family)